MKAKVNKVVKTSTSKLVDIKKTKADIQKAKTPKKEVEATAKKVAAGIVAAPLSFAKKKVLSVKRKAKTAKGTPIEAKCSYATVLVKPNVKTTTASIKQKQAAAKTSVQTSPKPASKTIKQKVPAADKGSVPEASAKKAEEGVKKVGEQDKHVGKKTGANKAAKKAAAKQAASDTTKLSPNDSAKGAKKNVKKRNAKQGKTKKEAKVRPQFKPRETGPVATEVTEEALAQVPEQLISADSFKLLFEHVQKKARGFEKNRLFGEDIKYALFLTAVKIPKYPIRTCRVTLPHSTLRKQDDVCLIVTDLRRGRKVDYESTVHHWQDKLSALGVSESAVHVVPFQQLKHDYASYEMKRKLVHRYGRFMVDARISGHVYGFLGKTFTVRKKTPVPIKLDKDESIKANIEKALRSETYHQSNSSEQMTIPFAIDWMPVEHAVENGMALLEKLKEIHPGGWLNIQSIYLTSTSAEIASFPIYMSVIDRNLVPVPQKVGPRKEFIQKQNEKMMKATGGKYGITPNGVVKKLKLKKKDKKKVKVSKGNKSDEPMDKDQTDDKTKEDVHQESLEEDEEEEFFDDEQEPSSEEDE